MVAMSGGVDSSVAALLLKQQGWEVLGVTFHLFGCDIARRTEESKSCCSRQDVLDAVKVALKLGIHHQVVDFSSEFEKWVISPFVAGYRAGETPNPCILCNRHIKFGAFLEFAGRNGAGYIATGHHAVINRSGDKWRLSKGTDGAKDQSYFLFPLDQSVMPSVLFPVGAFTKAQVRSMAENSGLPVADKGESQEICFAAGGSYVDFLEISAGLSPVPGDIVLADGRVVGRHDGLHRHTIGQRRGLRVSHPVPLYVVEKQVESNRLLVGPAESLACWALEARAPIWTEDRPPEPGERLQARVRYRSPEIAALVESAADTGFALSFPKPVNGVAPGQAAVLYRDDTVIGGGWVRSTSRREP